MPVPPRALLPWVRHGIASDDGRDAPFGARAAHRRRTLGADHRTAFNVGVPFVITRGETG
jgi:hypothetical protein